MSHLALTYLAALAAVLATVLSLYQFELAGARRMLRLQADWLALAVLSSGAAFTMLAFSA